MNSKLHDERGVNNKDSATPEKAKSEPVQDSGDISVGNTDHHKKKYHFSAMYAASMWHNPVQYVRPQHNGIKS